MARTQLTVRVFQEKIQNKSKDRKDFRFYSLYDKIYRLDILMESYRRCRAKKGGPGCDGITFSDIERNGVVPWLREISESLRRKTYKAQAVKRVYIEKTEQPGKFRPLGIPTIRDRVVQGACKIVIEPIFEPHLNEGSYGYRPKRGAIDAVKHVEGLMKEGYRYVYDADIEGYFDNIPHDKLIAKVERRIRDKSLLALLRQFLSAPVQFSDEKRAVSNTKPDMGTPQGGVISPLLANIYLNDFSNLITSTTPYRMVSYADDFRILHREPYTESQIEWFRDTLALEGLSINEAKTRMVDMTQENAEFNFLSFTFRTPKGQHLRIEPSKKSQERFKTSIRDIVKRTSFTLSEAITKVNRIVRGWRNYFGSCGDPNSVFHELNFFVLGQFHRWTRKLSQHRSNCIAPDPLQKLIEQGLEFLSPPQLSPAMV